MTEEIARLPHGYTNATEREGETVTKRYTGPDADVRRQREATALDRLADVLPVPPLLARTPDALVLGLVDGVPGQQLLLDRPEEVLHAVGRLARRLAQVDVAAVLGPGPPGAILVHGDFGPQNVLLDPDAAGGPAITALLDWEWVHLGNPGEDLAWAEWIVRTHHPDLVGALPALFEGYGERPPWAERRAAMLSRCHELSAFVARWGGPGVAEWDRRRSATETFSEELVPTRRLT